MKTSSAKRFGRISTRLSAKPFGLKVRTGQVTLAAAILGSSLLGTLPAAGPALARDGDRATGTLAQASGVYFSSGSFWLVGNDRVSRDKYFELRVDPAELGARPWPIPRDELRTHKMKTRLGDDLEAIDELSGRIVVLSEQHALLLDAKGTVIDFSNCSDLEERGNRGLEGLAVWREGTRDWVAVAYEGGQLVGSRTVRSPRILALEMAPPAGRRGRPRTPDCRALKLDSGKLREHLATADPVRAPGLETVPLPGEATGFLLLLSTEPEKWLQKVDRQGRLRGCAQQLSELDGAAVKENWEGLAWIDRDRRQVVLVNDTDEPDGEGTSLWKVTLSEAFLRDAAIGPDCSSQ